MKQHQPEEILSPQLLRYVRDHRPLAEAFMAEYGGPHGQHYHVLRKSGSLILNEGRVELNPKHLSPDGKFFIWGIRVFQLDSEVVRFVCKKTLQTD